ncbi:nucleotidyltransferase domain-containing protein [Spirosoma koreense]
MKADRSPEIVLLLMACTVELTTDRQVQLTQFLEQRPIDWDRLYALANRHRVSPFLYRTLQRMPNLPQPFLNTLQNDCRLIATDNLLKLHHYRELSQLLTSKGIDHISLKGIYLASTAYPDSGLRSVGDLDILVKEKDALPTIHLLQSVGYQMNQRHASYQHEDERSMLTDLSEISLFKPFFNTSHFDIDLHWGVVCFNKDYKVFELGEIARQPELAIEWQVILLTTHHGVTNIWQHIYYINDLYFLIRNKSIDWAWLMPELSRYGLETTFLAGMHWCQEIWQLPIPPAIQDLISAKVLRLVDAYEKNWEALLPVASSQLIIDQVSFFAKAQTQPRKRLKMGVTFFSSRVLRASTFKVGRRLVYIPKELGFITVFVRALRSLSRFLPSHR